MFQLVGPHGAVQILGVKLVGANAENGRKLLFSIIFIVLVILLGRLVRWLANRLLSGGRHTERVRFWTRQGINLTVAVVTVVGLVSIWFDDPTRLTTALGLVSAGLAFALQRVITAFAAYFVLLRGKTFSVGDRITMGGVRGDVIALDLIQTTIMEMGQPPGEQGDAPAMWVRARQYTGRIVTVTNDKIFDEPVYNYSRDFPYLWEEMAIPISYDADRATAERILLDVARESTVQLSEIGEEALRELERRYFMKRSDLQPHVFWRLTDNWLEMSLRFVAMDYGVRTLKDRMSREILKRFDDHKITLASGTYQVVGFPPIRIENWPPPRADGAQSRI
jgi:small-conductance mechanosensitive channel